MTEVTNGNGLPNDRQAAIEYGLVQFQTIAAERDDLHKENIALKTEIAGLKVAFEAQQAQINDMDSKVSTMSLIRDQAVADRTVYEVLFVSLQAQMRAFAVPSAPLIKDAEA